MKKSIVVLTVLAILVLFVGVGSAAADRESRNYRWLAGAGVVDFPAAGGLLCDLGTPCPDVARASNGDTIEITGEGTLSVHPKSVSGGGSFTHNFAGGGSVSGTWTVTKLLHFESYGSPPAAVGLPSTWEAGRAKMEVHLVADGMEADAILTVGCILPGVEVPGRLFEGSTLKVKGVANFKMADLGATLFIRL